MKPKTRRSDQEVAGLGHQKSHNMEDQGDPDGQRQQAGCGDQGGEPGDIGHLNSQWEHHGQEGDHQAQVDQEEIHGADQGQESEKSYKGPKSKEGNLRSHSNPNMTQRKRVAKEDNHMKHMMKRDNEEMTKRMDDHNHMMRKDSVKKVEKKKTKATKVPLLMGLGLPVLRKRFLNSFQVSIMIIRIRTMMPTMTMMSMIRTSGRTMPAGESTRGRGNIWILSSSLRRRTLSRPRRRNAALEARRREAGLSCKSLIQPCGSARERILMRQRHTLCSAGKGCF